MLETIVECTAKLAPKESPRLRWRGASVLVTLTRFAAPTRLPYITVISIVLPAKNEIAALAELLPRLRETQPDAEIIVVDDGSSDDTATICARHGITTVRQPYSMGNGAAIKRGARIARGEVIVFMDADGQHDPADIERLVVRIS